ncbi:MAG: DENN domain-containing protein [Asgard group archaeon]|nr:DENN domain-containing protein [Asgard group archaeon]
MNSDHPWEDSESTPTHSPPEPTSPKQHKLQPPGTKTGACELRPLRLTKQRNRASIISISSTSSGGLTPTASSFTSPSRKSSLATEEFHCRPIRLGRNASATEERRSSDASVSKTPEKQPEAKKSLESALSTPPNETARQLIDSEQSNLSNTSKRKSILIRNLPITSTTTSRRSESKFDDMIFAICLVDFHHQRGPEIQWWKSNYHPEYQPDLFKNIPFQALPDGSHLFEETFSNFNLVYDFDQKKSVDDFKDVNDFKGDPRHLKTLFGCSCVRQVKTSDLSEEERERNKDITRSIVQKAIVVIVRKQPIFTKIKDKLSIITKSYFQQETFSNFELLENLFDNLNGQFKLIDNEMHTELEQEEEYYVNLNLKSTLTKFRLRFMIIFKSLLLEKKVLIYSNNNLEALTQFQNNLISLMPNLINNLDDSGCPLIDYAETNGPLSKPQSLNTTSRASMLRFFGLPLQIFNTKNSFWNPYLPLQQLDELSVQGFMVGCSNLLFVNQASMFGVDLLINLDTNEVTYPKDVYTPEELHLSSMDKKFINHLINSDANNTKHDDYMGSDDFIRYQFEDYLNSLISTMRYNQYSERFGQPPPGFNEASHVNDFNPKFIESWRKTQNFKIWNTIADEFIFNFIEPKHVATDIKNEPYSINKNISNFFNSFKSKNTTTNVGNGPDTIKVHKFIEEEEPPTRNVDENSSNNDNHDGNVDELVAGFEKVGPTEDKLASNGNKRVSSWTAGWVFGAKK